MMLTTINDTAFAILDALRVYRYLTADQLHRLAVSPNLSHIYEVLRGLRERSKPLVDKIDHGSEVGIGKIAGLHYLTKRGAQLLADALMIEPGAVPYPRGAVVIRSHYFHRLHSVDCEIAVRQWAEKNTAAVEFYQQYFSYVGANRTKKSGDERRHAVTSMRLLSGEVLVPDGAFRLELADGRRPLFLLEMYNQRRTLRMVDQAKKYVDAISQHVINKRFDYPKAPRILFVFEDEKALFLTKKRMQDVPALSGEYARYFFFQTLPVLRHDFQNNWQRIDSSAPESII